MECLYVKLNGVRGLKQLLDDFNELNFIDVLYLNALKPQDKKLLWERFHLMLPNSCNRDAKQMNDAFGLYAMINELIGNNDEIRVLDVGCGSEGNAISTLVTKYKPMVKGYGVDIHLGKRPCNVRLVELDLETEKLPFRTEFFDVVYSYNLMMYINKDWKQDVINELFRVLTPGGVYINNREVLKK